MNTDRPRRRPLSTAPSAMFALTVLAVLSAGCGETGGRSSASVRDSAGITIVENPAALGQQPLWSIAPDPLVEIGVIEGDDAYQLSEVRGATRLSDGRLVVANAATQELRFYDPTGAHLRSVGRKGGGPGEFDGLGLTLRGAGDTVIAYDWNHRRLSFFGPDGTFARSVPWRFEAGFPIPIGPFADGTWLSNRGMVFGPGSNGSQVVRDTVPFLVFDTTGALRDSIGRFPQFEFYVVTEGRSSFASSLPLGRATEAAVAGDRFYAGHNEQYEITRFTPAGQPELIIRLEHTPVPVTRADVDTLKAERLRDADDNWRQRMERMFQEMPLPATFPTFADLAVDANGNLWVLDYPRPGRKERHWTVFSAEGRALGSVTTPPGLQVFEIGRDYVLGVWRDELDVQYVRLHRLDRGTE